MMRLGFACALLCASASSLAGPDYQVGRISNVTFETDRVLIVLDSGLPQYCTGMPWC